MVLDTSLKSRYESIWLIIKVGRVPTNPSSTARKVLTLEYRKIIIDRIMYNTIDSIDERSYNLCLALEMVWP